MLKYSLIILLSLPLLLFSQKGRLQVSVDERIELLTTVQLLSGYRWLTEADLDYKKEVLTYFSNYKNHKAVEFYKSISERFYGYNPILLLCHYELPSFKLIADFTEEDKAILKYNQTKDTLKQFISSLKDFYKISGFHEFYKSHEQFYRSISALIIAESERIDYAGIMEKHFGSKNYSYHVILSPLQMDAGFGPSVLTKKKGTILYAIVGPDYQSKTIPVFNKEAVFQELVLHEFSHSFCNYLIDKYYSELEKDSCLLKPIIKSQKEQGYGDWKTCLYEHLTRANEIELNRIIYSDSVADNLFQIQVNEDKWIYLEGLVPLIKNIYSRDRGKYKTLEAFMPEIVQYFDMEKKNCR